MKGTIEDESVTEIHDRLKAARAGAIAGIIATSRSM
jgi:hypothetical protein